MNKVVVQAKTVELAVASALEQLNTTRDKVQIRVLEQPKKGFFGLFGVREARVEVERMMDPVEEAVAFVQNVTRMLGFQVSIHIKERGSRKKPVVLELVGEDLGLLIGKKGSRIAALQFLAEIVANRQIPKLRDKRRLILDADGYRERRKEALVALAHRVAERVIQTQKEVSLDPMPAMDRKIIHQTLQKMKQITTHSVGKEPFRYVVVGYKSIQSLRGE
ncbi:RNA-binding cell elongation regulator Jag/EloR [Thermoflavimicrobium dichotomicum]|uniref:RNA-binding protein KhpB n=1 Tax=Thermoflavimicrobium dichotomicum TaxID=46223 RepID=A0A1I3KE92_9BACL|nr:RNA-binding cell elongation regulator Jag/EloR [Thermoflavimicrobium dichotomicum]SFI70608.1 spoIIIJ-associated protein [Thermoflavimicrobium dichotomicum]